MQPGRALQQQRHVGERAGGHERDRLGGVAASSRRGARPCASSSSAAPAGSGSSAPSMPLSPCTCGAVRSSFARRGGRARSHGQVGPSASASTRNAFSVALQRRVAGHRGDASTSSSGPVRASRSARASSWPGSQSRMTGIVTPEASHPVDSRQVSSDRLRNRGGDMDLFVILRRNGFADADALSDATTRSVRVSNEEMPDEIRWVRAYVLDEGRRWARHHLRLPGHGRGGDPRARQARRAADRRDRRRIGHDPRPSRPGRSSRAAPRCHFGAATRVHGPAVHGSRRPDVEHGCDQDAREQPPERRADAAEARAGRGDEERDDRRVAVARAPRDVLGDRERRARPRACPAAPGPATDSISPAGATRGQADKSPAPRPNAMYVNAAAARRSSARGSGSASSPAQSAALIREVNDVRRARAGAMPATVSTSTARTGGS